MPLILIVEDDPGIADIIAEAVVSHVGHQVRVVGTAAQALIAAASERPDAVLLDIGLPDASGTVGLDRLRMLLPRVPIIMLTGNIDEELARQTLRRGAFDYIMKPFDVGRLMSVLEAAVSG